MKKIDILLLTIILFIALAFRLYKINAPLADFHSWRQVDTAAVARNFVRSGFDLLHPRYDDVSASSTGFDNPQGYRFVEFPLYNAIFGFMYRYLPIFSLETWGRLVSVLFSLITIGIIYYLTYKESSRIAAAIASLTYAILPYLVFFSRTVLPETTALGLSFISIFFLYLYVNKRAFDFGSVLSYILALTFFSLSLLVKPTTIFFAVILLYLFFKKYRFDIFKRLDVYLFFIIAFLPLYFWREYIKAIPEASPPNEWLIFKVNTYEGQKDIFFRPAFFRWIFFERINNYILGGYLTFLFILGILAKPKSFIFHFLLLSSLSYLFVFQGGNVQHEYYQILIFPSLAIFIGVGVSYLTKNSRNLLSLIVYPTILAVICASFLFSYYKVKDYYNIPSDLIHIARIVNTLTKADDKIVTERSGDTTLLYLIDRRGSPGIYKNIADYKKDNYQYLVTAVKETITKLKAEKLKVIFEDNQFALFRL